MRVIKWVCLIIFGSAVFSPQASLCAGNPVLYENDQGLISFTMNNPTLDEVLQVLCDREDIQIFLTRSLAPAPRVEIDVEQKTLAEILRRVLKDYSYAIVYHSSDHTREELSGLLEPDAFNGNRLTLFSPHTPEDQSIARVHHTLAKPAKKQGSPNHSINHGDRPLQAESGPTRLTHPYQQKQGYADTNTDDRRAGAEVDPDLSGGEIRSPTARTNPDTYHNDRSSRIAAMGSSTVQPDMASQTEPGRVQIQAPGSKSVHTLHDIEKILTEMAHYLEQEQQKWESVKGPYAAKVDVEAILLDMKYDLGAE